MYHIGLPIISETSLDVLVQLSPNALVMHWCAGGESLEEREGGRESVAMIMLNGCLQMFLVS